MGKKSRKEKKEESKLNRQLFTYSLAAGAALVMAQPADARIVCSQLTTPIEVDSDNDPPVNAVCIDLDGDLNNDFCFWYSSGYACGVFYRSIGMGAYTSNAFLGSPAPSWDAYASRLAPNDPIGPSQTNWFHGSSGVLNGLFSSCAAPPPDKAARIFCTDWNGPFGYGDFCEGDPRGYIGVRFESGGQTHYGWIDYEGDCNFGAIAVSGLIYGWCYEDGEDAAIMAGERQEIPVPTLNPFGLLILAGLILAAGGVAVTRRKKKES
jgi:hypothetical protein